MACLTFSPCDAARQFGELGALAAQPRRAWRQWFGLKPCFLFDVISQPSVAAICPPPGNARSIVRDDLDCAAELTVWLRCTPARTAQRREFATLREALREAAAAAAVSRGDVQTWIITEAGDILSPGYIEASLPNRRTRHPSKPPTKLLASRHDFGRGLSSKGP